MHSRTLMHALGWAAGTWLLWRVPRCQGEAVGTGGAARASVVIPARNEAATLPGLLDSLAAQQPPAAEIVVADDGSSDATAEVAREAGATVVTLQGLPAGWTGKTWACWAGARATAAPLLLFLDADCKVAPGGLARLLSEHRRHGGLVSIQPYHRTERAYEVLSAYFNLVAMMAVEAFTPLSRRRRPTGAFGPCLVCTREDYLRAGGHEAVAGEVLEDVALARRFTEAGIAVTCLGGRGTLEFRMYPEGLGQLVEGWTKNFAAGARATRPLTFVLVFAWLSSSIGAAWLLGETILGRGRSRALPALAAYTVHAAQLQWMLRRTGRFPAWTAPAYPLPLAGFLAVFGRSLMVTFGRRAVTWKGRAVAVGRPVPQAARTGRRRAARTSAKGS